MSKTNIKKLLLSLGVITICVPSTMLLISCAEGNTGNGDNPDIKPPTDPDTKPPVNPDIKPPENFVSDGL